MIETILKLLTVENILELWILMKRYVANVFIIEAMNV